MSAYLNRRGVLTLRFLSERLANTSSNGWSPYYRDFKFARPRIYSEPASHCNGSSANTTHLRHTLTTRMLSTAAGSFNERNTSESAQVGDVISRRLSEISVELINNKMSIAATEAEIQTVKVTISNVQRKISDIEDSLSKPGIFIDDQLNHLEKEMQNYREKNLLDEKSKLQDEKSKLLDKENKLLDKENKLLDKENKLLDKEKDLGQEKKDLEKKILDLEKKIKLANQVFKSPEAIKRLLEFGHNEKLIPNQIGDAFELVDLGSISRTECQLLNREAAATKFLNITKIRLEKEKMSDKECHPHVLCMSAPGTGKSRFADYGLLALKKAPKETYPALHALANDHALAVHVTFNSDTKFNDKDKAIGIDAALACRILASYFRSEKYEYANYLELLRDTPGIKTLTPRHCIRLILQDHRQRNGLAPDKKVLFYLAVDDITSLLQDKPESDSELFIKELLGSIEVLYSNWENEFVVIIVTGTVFGPVSSIIKTTSRPYTNLPVPLLTFDQSKELAVEAFRRKNLDTTLPKELLLLIGDVGGVPRFVWKAINCYLNAPKKNGNPDSSKLSISNSDAIYCNLSVLYEMKERYSVTKVLKDHNPELVLMILFVAFTKQRVSPSNPICLSADMTWIDLENEGRIFFEIVPYSMEVVIVLPLAYLEVYGTLLGFASLKEAVLLVNALDWQSMEKFVLAYDKVLLILYSLNKIKYVPVKDYYEGALIGDKRKDLKLHIPSNLTVDMEAFESLSTRSLEAKNNNEKYMKSLVAGTNYLNAAGAKIDGFSIHRDPTNHPVVRAFSIKFTSKQEPFNLINARGQAISSMESVCPTLESNTRVLDVFISNRELCGAFSAKDSDDVVVCKDQVAGFFGRSFAHRINFADYGNK